MYYAFERNTPAVRQVLTALFSPASRASKHRSGQLAGWGGSEQLALYGPLHLRRTGGAAPPVLGPPWRPTASRQVSLALGVDKGQSGWRWPAVINAKLISARKE